MAFLMALTLGYSFIILFFTLKYTYKVLKTLQEVRVILQDLFFDLVGI